MTAQLVHAEWTKFRTVRGWVIGIFIAVLATVGVSSLSNSSCGGQGGGGCPASPIGPDGEAVQDASYFAHQPVTGNGTITARITSLTGERPASGGLPVPGSGQSARMEPFLAPWAKAGVLIKASTSQGSAYVAMLVTGGNGVRMQWNYTGDTPGLAGQVTAASPRWLRLIRSGDTFTGYDSADGTHWIQVGTVTLPGLRSTVQAGLFAASPLYSHTTSSGIGGSSGDVFPSQATAALDHVGLSWPTGTWTGDDIGGNAGNGPPLAGDFHQANGAFTVTGSGDIAPQVGGNGAGISLNMTLAGTFAGLIAMIVVAALFITAEYRRGLIRLTLAASPYRGRVLAAKALVIGAVSFVAGLAAVAIAVPLGESRLRANGNFILPVPALTEVRVLAGTAAFLAVAAVLALAIGAAVRRSAAAVATVITAIFVPYLLGGVPGLLPESVQDWLLRITPAAGFAIQQAYPRYPQVTSVDGYRPAGGYYPLAPWAGFAVLCAWAAAGLVLATVLLRRRDA